MPDPGNDPSERSLLTVPGIGPARGRLLEAIGLRSLGDALLHLPHRYEDRRRIDSIGDLSDGAAAAVRGEVVSARVARMSSGPRGRVFEVILDDGTGTVRARWFHFRGLPLSPLFRPGSLLVLYGPVGRRGRQPEMVHPEVAPAGKGGLAGIGRIVPVYPAAEGLSQKVLRRATAAAVEQAAAGEEGFLPPGTGVRLGLPGRAESLEALHAPPDDAPLDLLNSRRTPWHRRLAFDELFVLQLGLALRRRRDMEASPGEALEPREKMVDALRERLPFELTPGQREAYGEIAGDMCSTRPMRRLLQGDVGSGKTVVAVMASLLAVGNGRQAALMVPTEILAEQHYLTLREMVVPLGVRVALLTGSLSAAQRGGVHEGLRRGTVDIVVGTHSLIQGPVAFRRLALAVIDEQHRFGVRQRLALRRKGRRPDLLVMTATPIPRTLALTLYGDFDVTRIGGLPPGRGRVRTRLGGEGDRRRLQEEIRKELRRGGRAYVVLPYIEGKPEKEEGAAVKMAEHLRRDVYPEFSVGLLHGRMGMGERAEVMKRFREGRIDVLVATTVIEVGVDVPEATVMVVEHADRFGLSQLHQLRGRVGRGEAPSRCYLLLSRQAGADSRRRLEAAAAITDGLQLAEADLAMRGAGDLLGTRQSGLPPLKIADLSRDLETLLLAREECLRVIARDPRLDLPEHRRLRSEVENVWQERFCLAPDGSCGINPGLFKDSVGEYAKERARENQEGTAEAEAGTPRPDAGRR